MTPAKRRPATPDGDGPPKAAVAKRSAKRAPTKDAATEAAPAPETAPAEPEDRAPSQPPARSRALHPERVWPD